MTNLIDQSQSVSVAKTKVDSRELAVLIADAINNSNTIYRATLWNKKDNESRIYVSYSNKNKKKECGYVRVMDTGVVYRHLTLQGGTIENIYSDVLESVEVIPIELKPSNTDTITTSSIVEECWECGATFTTLGNVESGNMGCVRCN